MMTALQGRCHYTRLISEQIEAQRGGNLPKDTQFINGSARMLTQVADSNVTSNGH